MELQAMIAPWLRELREYHNKNLYKFEKRAMKVWTVI